MRDLLEEKITMQVRPIVDGMGFSLVELRHARSKHQSYISIIVYRPEGVGIEDCAAISRNLYPLLELEEELGDFRLEVSSPGLGRVIKSRQEYEIFRGRGLRILRVGTEEWSGGVIEGLRGDSLVLKERGAVTEIPLAEIRKARLDDGQEVGN
jgi:ribosome maturation factor RimP